MKNFIVFGFLVFALTGLLVPSTISEVFSEQPENKPQACNNEQAKHKGNKHCDGGTEPPTDPQFTNCDSNPINGQISATELSDASTNITLEDAETFIGISEDVAGSKGQEINMLIDTIEELESLTSELTKRHITNPCIL